MGIEIEACRPDELPALHRAMNAAFSDYLVPLSLTFEQFRFMLRQRGFDPALSWVAKANGAIVSFWIIAAEPEIETDRVYTIATGTLPEFRGQGLSERVFHAARDRLASRGFSTLRLEVLEENHAARMLYEKLGFSPLRRLACFGLETSGATPPSRGSYRLRRFDLAAIRDQLDALQDWRPTWQNSFESLSRIADSVTALGFFDDGLCLGYGALIEPSSVVAQLAIRPGHRRHGLGSAVLAALAGHRSKLEILNVDQADLGSRSFFESLGAKFQTVQFELARPLSDRP